MSDAPRSLPPDLESVILRILDADSGDAGRQIERLCHAHPDHALAIHGLVRTFRGDDGVTGSEPDTLDNPDGDRTTDRAPERIGPYRILSELGEGGMGTVFLAEQKTPMRRRVALKVIKLGMDSRAVLNRFEAERQALAMMEHGNIARIYDAGLTDSGQPYFAMEYVKGVPITRYCDENKLPLEERLALFRRVCSGVQHAHNKGVIHRDLTPNNVLVTVQDGEPTPKIIDFGLARATDHRLVEATVFTEQGQIVGTPEYMSPEQAGLGGLDIDTRTDVYTLGVLLYELLVGGLPFPTQELRSAGLLEMQRKIREDEPPRPSTRLTTLNMSAPELAARRKTQIGTLQRRLRQDLDWVVMHALEKDRTRRYETASELAADVGRYLAGEPVTAGPPAASYRLGKLVRRYRGQVLATAAVFVALAVGLVFALLQRAEAGQQRELAQRQAREAIRLQGIADEERKRAEAANAGFRRLRDVVVLEDLETRASTDLSPETRRQHEMEDWLTDAEAWIADMPDHRAYLVAFREESLERGTAALLPPSFVILAFAEEEDQFLHDNLTLLVDGVAQFTGPGGALQTVRDSLDWARRVEQVTIDDAAAAWRSARRSIVTHPAYGGSDLQPQLGLVPLEPDPRSKLWEFWMPRSGERPTRGRDGSWNVEADTGLVLVLVPAGELEMGSDPGEGVYPNEMPRHRVQLDAFFVSKYEITQAQWKRLARAENPSAWQVEPREDGDPNHTLNDPVERVSWLDATLVLALHDLELPTEAQWEYACRAGTDTRWCFGDARGDLSLSFFGNTVARVNIASEFGQDGAWPDSVLWQEYTDGHIVHAPVGSFPPNDFGLHEVHGNVAEWCRDHYYRDFSAVRHASGDGAWIAPSDIGAGSQRVIRGGSFFRSAEEARSARRNAVGEDQRFDNIGVRPVRAIDR